MSAQGAGVSSVQRGLFEIPDAITYLNCANLSPQLRAVTDMGIAAVRRKSSPWTVRADDWFAPTEQLRALFAEIIHADTDGIALVPSVSYGIAIAASNLPVARGQAIVLLADEFPSNVYAWRELAEKREAVVRTVPRRSTGAWTDSVVQAITSDTAIVSVPNCHWTDGRFVDLVKIGEATRRVGAALVIDGSQSIGAYPLDVAAVQPDFLVTVGYKWLLGPYGLGYLYVSPRWRTQGMPLEHSWLTRAHAEEFARLTEYAHDFRPGARRFDMGEFPQFVLTAMATAALRQLLAWGVEHIQASLSTLTLEVERGALGIGAEPVAAQDRVDHMIGVRPHSGVKSPLVESLAAADVYVSVRGDAIRVAPHLYNTSADIDRLLDVLRRSGS